MSAPTFVQGVGAFAGRYDGFILDQWGVLHDGLRPYPGVLATLGELACAGKRIVLLSNSGRRADNARRRLVELGFDLSLFAAVVTSGETTWDLLRQRRAEPFASLGRRCLLLTREGDRTVAEGLGLEGVEDVADADWVFLSGVEPPPATAEDYAPVLDAALARGLPLLCANPDRVAVSGSELTLAPGTLAERYEAEGGRVIYVGKPHLPIYAACLDALAGLERSRIVCIGDSLQHDIKGANSAGLASAFVSQGIHAVEFPPDADPAALARTLEELCADRGAWPDWVIPRLAW
jgi:HAD superfamily hydrolase (TIGR01459 family)